VRFSDENGVMLIRETTGITLDESEKLVLGTERFCELCWRQSERAQWESTAKRYVRKRGSVLKRVEEPFPNSKTATFSRQVLDVFLFALDGERHPHLPIVAAQVGGCDWDEVEMVYLAPRMMLWIGGGQFLRLRDRFRDYFECEVGTPLRARIMSSTKLVDELCALIEDAIVRDKIAPADLVEQPSVRLSRRFCQLHNQRRGGEAMRLYKRDHARKTEFEAELEIVGRRLLKEEFFVARNGDLDAITRVRKEAYLSLSEPELVPKYRRPSVKNGATIEAIKQLQMQGFVRQTDIARQLGISRAAVSIALKRQLAKHEQDSQDSRSTNP
jgi:hypothetical protein